jgi:hypothetical protein
MEKLFLMKRGRLSLKKGWIILLLCVPLSLSAQEKPKNWQLTGYVKTLQSLNFVKVPVLDTTLLLLDNLIHNRLNFTWYINDQLTFRADMRNRIFYGDFVKLNPLYAKSLEETANDFFDLSVIIFERNDFIIHSMLDRLYMDYTKGNWEVRLGRQRINWGINTAWNPNDIFNAYSFTDFDYEERPGSDAFRLKYYTGFASSIEFAIKAFDKKEDAVAGILWKTNKWNYDFQVLAGIMQQDLTFGGGWAGNIKDASFKGEVTYFHSLQDTITSSFAGTIGVDYSFKNSLYINGGFLYNSNGRDSLALGGGTIFVFDVSAKNLYPYKYSIFTQVLYPFTPILSGGLALIYSPSFDQALFINPTLTYSIAENWDFDLIGQVSFSKSQEKKYESPATAIFMRFKFSF